MMWNVLSCFYHAVILGQGLKVEQFKLIGYTLYKYIWKKKINKITCRDLVTVLPLHLPLFADWRKIKFN